MATLAQVLASDHISVAGGMRTVDKSGNTLQDVSDYLTACTVSSNIYASLHRSMRMELDTELAWASARVQPYITLSSSVGSVTFNLGVYLCGSPTKQAAEAIPRWQVDGYDLLTIPNTLVGATYRVAAGVSYLTTVTTILTDLGESAARVQLNTSAMAKTLPADMVWALDERTTWLNIINDLLDAVGYTGLYVDRDGVWRADPYVAPSSRAPVWAYTADNPLTSIIGVDRTYVVDIWSAPNKWVFYNRAPGQSVLPTEGSGIVTFINQSTGQASIDARGWTKTKVVGVDAADQASLILYGSRVVADDLRLDSRMNMKVVPNPAHWHLDVVTLADSAAGIGAGTIFSVEEWSLDVTGEDMTLKLRRAS